MISDHCVTLGLKLVTALTIFNGNCTAVCHQCGLRYIYIYPMESYILAVYRTQ